MKWSCAWQASTSLPNQEIPHTSGSAKIHYSVHKSLPLLPVLRWVNPVHTIPSYFYKIHFNTSLPTMPESSSGLLPSALPTKTLHEFLFPPICATCPTHLILLHVINLIFGKDCKSSLLIMQFHSSSCYFLYPRPPQPSSLYGYINASIKKNHSKFAVFTY
jgi:hypothetical protein